jgi:putative transposase
MIRKEIFKSNTIYHLCNKSIAGFKIFKNKENCIRFLKVLYYYNTNNYITRFSYANKKGDLNNSQLIYPKKDSKIKFISYCIMPDHYHILIKILKNNCLSRYINTVEGSFTRYLNIKLHRKGPLWQSAFKAIRVKTQEQLIHVTRYIHLNPTTDKLVKNPEDWEFSSFKDYIFDKKILQNILIELTIKNIDTYKKFVLNRKDYQQKLKKIRKLLLE